MAAKQPAKRSSARVPAKVAARKPAPSKKVAVQPKPAPKKKGHDHELRYMGDVVEDEQRFQVFSCSGCEGQRVPVNPDGTEIT